MSGGFCFQVERFAIMLQEKKRKREKEKRQGGARQLMRILNQSIPNKSSALIRYEYGLALFIPIKI